MKRHEAFYLQCFTSEVHGLDITISLLIVNICNNELL